MELTFDLGDHQKPKGHALVYFRVSTEPDKVYATYVVVLPVKADLTKYVPPFLASHLGNIPLDEFSAFAMPPVPEPVDSYQELERLSRMRDDDLVYGSSMFSFDLPRMMETVNEAVQAYSQICADYFKDVSGSAPGQELESSRSADTAVDDSAFGVYDVLYGFMSESDKLAELSRLMSKLRFAVEGRDRVVADEAADEISTLGRHLPDSFQIADLLAAAQDTSVKGSRLAQLYLDRCFRLSSGEHQKAQVIEEQINALKSE